jgi:hypothetical protein
MAKDIGLGRRRQKPVAAEPTTGKETKREVASQSQPAAKRKPDRPRKATA